MLDNAGRPSEARTFHQHAVTLAREQGDHASAAICLHNMAVNCIDVGELAQAADLLQECARLRLAHDGL